MTLNLKICRFSPESINFLGYVKCPRCLKIDSQTTDVIRGIAPTKLTEFNSFLGLRNVFRRFVPNFARLATMLNKKLRKDRPVIFEPLKDEKTQSLNTLMEALMSPSVMVLSISTGHLTVVTDSCTVQVRCVLLQQQVKCTE